MREESVFSKTVFTLAIIRKKRESKTEFACLLSLVVGLLIVILFSSNHNGSTPLVLAKRRGVNKDAIRLLEGLEEQEVKGFNRGPHSKLETMQMADSERLVWKSME